MKMKKTRKRIALLIMLCMLTMLLPVGTGYANEQESNDMDYIFSGSNNATLIKYKGKESHVTIPDNVQTINAGAFAGCTDIESITIPKNVSSIRGNAFTGCSNLEAFHVVAENTTYCAVEGVLFKKLQGKPATLVAYPANKEDTSYTLPDSVTSIFDDAFQSCPNLEEIIFTPTSASDCSAEGGGVVQNCDHKWSSRKTAHQIPRGQNRSILYDSSWCEQSE